MKEVISQDMAAANGRGFGGGPQTCRTTLFGGGASVLSADVVR
jgi:hypothetical protein